MNKILLKILVILALIAPACADAGYKRVDSPGVAQRKLNLLLKDVRNMTESEKEQALADLSPSLKQDYQDALDAVPVRNKTNFNMAFIIIKKKIEEKELSNKERIFEFADILKRELNLNEKETEELKTLVKAILNEKDKGSDANQQLFETLDKLDEADKNLALFLEKLNEYFNKNLNNETVPYKVNTEKNYFVKNRFDSAIEEYKKLDSYVNNFFLNLSQYIPKSNNLFRTTDNFLVIQDAFIKSFFPLVNELAVKLKNSSNQAALSNASRIITKGEEILKFKINGQDTVKERVLNNKSILSEAFDYGQSCIDIIKQDIKISEKLLKDQPEPETREGQLIDLNF